MEDSFQGQLQQTMSVAWQHNRNLGDCMIELYDKRLWTDVKFRCKDHDESERIYAHKIVLAARSPVFQAMFYGPCADGNGEVALENAEAKILDLVLRYIYCDTVILTEEVASAVLEMAHYYQITNLIQFCADYLLTIITSENACEILTLAMFYKVTTLCDACCTFIDKNAAKILKSDGFLELSEDCLAYILKGDTFYADEDVIFLKAEEWAQRKLEESNLEKTGANVRKILGDSFHFLRLPTMTLETLMACTRKKGYFSLEEFEEIIDFINKVPMATVKSNSCLARRAMGEIITLNNDYGEPIIIDNIRTSFQITLAKDVKLTHFIITEIRKYLQFNTEYYTDRDCPEVTIKKADIGSLYSNKALKVIDYWGSALDVKELKSTDGEYLSDKFDVVLSGSFKVSCQRASKLPQGEKKEAQEQNTLEVIFKQDFQLQSSDVTQRTISLSEPLMLTKITSPYTVEMQINFSCKSGIKMKTFCSYIKAVKSKCGQIQVQDIKGKFAGIKSLGFENISNREIINKNGTTCSEF